MYCKDIIRCHSSGGWNPGIKKISIQIFLDSRLRGNDKGERLDYRLRGNDVKKKDLDSCPRRNDRNKTMKGGIK